MNFLQEVSGLFHDFFQPKGNAWYIRADVMNDAQYNSSHGKQKK